MRYRDQGGIPLATLLLGALIVILVVGILATCDALFDDESEDNDLGAPALIAGHYDRDSDRSDGKNSRGDCEQSSNCQDNDFSPDLEDSPVIVCLPSSTCNFA